MTKVYKDDFEDVNKNPLLPQHPYRMLMCGSSGCGKTNMLLNLLLHKDSPFSQVYLFYKCHQSKYDLLKGKFENTKKRADKSLIMVEGMPDDRLIGVLEKHIATPKIVILDDLLSESRHSKLLADLFTRVSHHMNTSIVAMHQSIFNDKILRLNCEYMMLWNFPSDKSNARILFQQMEPMRWRQVYKAYEDCIKQSHAWFLIDFKCHHKGKPHLKYRPNAWDEVLLFEDKDPEFGTEDDVVLPAEN